MKKGLFIIFGCILVLSMVLVACKSTSTTSTTTTTKPGTTTATTKTTTTTTTTTTVDMYGGTWKEGATSAPARPIGYQPEANSDSYIYSTPCLETLVEAQQDGTISPLLATNWTVADDGSSVILSLRKGIKFHDGSDFNADVCKWNLDLEIAAKAANASSWKSVDKIDDYTVRINVTAYQNIMLYNLSTVVAQQISKVNVDKNGISGAEWNPIGTGAFIFVSYDTGSKITYKRNPNYWDPSKPYLEGLTF
jgi:peptide/nickel transport system substrate-binding protein